VRWLLCSFLAACGDNLVAESGGVFLSGNESASCAIAGDGALYCWGRLNGTDDAAGEQGDRDTGLPAHKFPEFRWREVSVTVGHACGIRDDGTLWCWGRNCAGQLGSLDRVSSIEPRQIGSQTNWRTVATGGGHSCAIDLDNSMACWGGIDLGQQDCANAPGEGITRFEGTWNAVSSSFYTTHALRSDGTLWRWNDFSIEEDPHTPHETPMQVGDTRWLAIATGLSGVYGVRDDRTLAFVQFDRTTEDTISSTPDWSDTLAARDHGCALKLDQTLHCWGRNDMGQLGTGLPSDEAVLEPIQLGTFAGWTGLSAGWAQSCGVYQGQVYCWGMNGDGEMGIGMPYDHEVRTPQQIGVQL
jgi:alpha-tubulin suppressor-like RCC1 family protein